MFPCLQLNPSQDYPQLKDRLDAIQADGYDGLRALSTRVVGGGATIVLFDDQCRNVGGLTPYEVEFRLITPARYPTVAFASRAMDRLDYLAGEVWVNAPAPPAALPAPLRAFSAWTLVPFNHSSGGSVSAPRTSQGSTSPDGVRVKRARSTLFGPVLSGGCVQRDRSEGTSARTALRLAEIAEIAEIGHQTARKLQKNE